MTDKPKIPLASIIVPVYNEEDAIPGFVSVIDDTLRSLSVNYEIIFIDDGSVDRTGSILSAYAQQQEHIKFIKLSRNFGKELALTAGIDFSEGDFLIPMDVDLQDPPALIPQFIDKWRQGYDVIYGQRLLRNSDTPAKRISARWFYRIFNWVSDIKVPEDAGDFRLIDKRVADVIRSMPERSRFMKGMFAWVGFKTTSIPYERPARFTGETKWRFWGLWNFALEGIISFSSIPLRIWLYIGVTIAGLAFAFGLFILVRTLLFGVDLPGYASLMVTVLFLGGIQLLSIGILGEYLSRIFVEVKARPKYIVESVSDNLSGRN